MRENLIARAAWYTSVGRPNFNQYAGGITLPDPDLPPATNNRITVNNAAIKAWSAQTAKVRLEYYFEGVGQVSVGAFRREIENFFGSVIFPVTPEFLALYDLDAATYGAFDASTQHNIAGTVRMSGLEFDYKQALTFLPRWARGLQVFANASACHGNDSANFAGYVPRVLGHQPDPRGFVPRLNYRGRNRQTPLTGRSIRPALSWGAKLPRRAGRVPVAQASALFNLRNVGDATGDTGPTTRSRPRTPNSASARLRLAVVVRDSRIVLIHHFTAEHRSSLRAEKQGSERNGRSRFFQTETHAKMSDEHRAELTGNRGRVDRGFSA